MSEDVEANGVSVMQNWVHLCFNKVIFFKFHNRNILLHSGAPFFLKK